MLNHLDWFDDWLREGTCHRSFSAQRILVISCTSHFYEFSWNHVVSVLDHFPCGSTLRDGVSHSNCCLRQHKFFRSWFELCIDFETNLRDVLAWFGVCKDHSSSVRSLEIYKCLKRLMIFNKKCWLFNLTIYQTAYGILCLIILPDL